MDINGFPVGATAADAHKTAKIVDYRVPGTHVSLPVCSDIAPLLIGLAAEFHQRVEPLKDGECWGFAYRNVTGGTTPSFHAAGIAIDLNAPAHGRGTRGTFTPAQAATCRALAGKYGCRWGGDYVTSVVDEMHFEVIRTRTDALALVQRLDLANPLAVRPTTPISMLSRETGHLDVFAVGFDGRTMTNAFAENKGWSGWSQVSGGVAAGRGDAGSPVTAVSPDGRELAIYTVGTDNQVYSTFAPPSAPWSGWSPHPGLTARRRATVTAHSRIPTEVMLFSTATDGKVMATDGNPRTRRPGWEGIADGVAAPGSPVTAISRHANQTDLFTVGTDNRVWSTVWQPDVGWWLWFPIGDLVCRRGAMVTALSRHPDHLDLFTTAQDGSIMTTFWEPDRGWSSWFGVSGGVTSPGSPVTALSRRVDQVDLFVLGTDNGVWTAQWNQDTNWANWTPVGGGQGLRGGHVAAASMYPHQVDVVVAGTDEKLWTTYRHDGSDFAEWWPLAAS